MTEAVAGMLDGARSGRREVEKAKHEDILFRILPVLNDAFTMKSASELLIGSYMICVALARKATLSNEVLDGLMEAIVGSWTDETISTGLVCVAILAQQKPDATIPKRVFKAVLRLENPLAQLSEVISQCPVSHLALGLVAGCLDDVVKQNNNGHLNFLPNVFDSKLLGDAEMSRGINMVLHTASNAHKSGEMSLDAQTQLAELVEHFNRSEALRPILQNVLAESSLDVATLEHNLQTVIEGVPAQNAIEDAEMEDVDTTREPEQDAFTPALESLASEKLFPTSFLAKQSIPVLDRLVQTFALSSGSLEKLDSFTNLPILGKNNVAESSQFLSFFTRVVAGSYPIGTRIAALRVISSVLTSMSGQNLDLQALLPFVLVTLSDNSERMRRESANVLAVLASCYKNKKDDAKPWAYDTWYGQVASPKIHWLSSRDAEKIFSRALLPGLEEFVLDPGHIGKVLEATLQGEPVPNKPDSLELKKSLRQALFNFLCSHAVHIPLFSSKLGLLRLLNRAGKVGSTSRTKELQPLLEWWRKLSTTDVEAACDTEHIPVFELEKQIVATVTAKEKDAITLLLSNVSPGAESLRPEFVSAVFDRLKAIWRHVSQDRQVTAAERLLDISLGLSEDDLSLVDNCKDVLRNVHLPGPVLVHFLQKIPMSVTDMETSGPAPKRRRTSQNNMVAMTVKDESELNKLMEKMTFILELVDSSKPEEHPELANGLFQTLAALHHFKTQIHSGMSYLLSLALGSLLAIVNRSKENAKPLFDTSVIRADLVVDCVRTTESPQVQNAALLLVAGLSTLAPELVLHSVMPIFTFMGSSVLKKDDDYSVSVIDQTIDQVVPALILSLRKQKRDVVSGTSELLLSFTAAFEHIPSHRRLRLFHALITKLGTQDFLFAVLAMLANRYAMDKDVLTLMTGLASDAAAPVELTVSFLTANSQ